MFSIGRGVEVWFEKNNAFRFVVARYVAFFIGVFSNSGGAHAAEGFGGPPCDHSFDASRKGTILNWTFKAETSLFWDLSLYFRRAVNQANEDLLNLLDAKEELYFSGELLSGESGRVTSSYFRDLRSFGSSFGYIKNYEVAATKYREAMIATLNEKLRGEKGRFVLMPRNSRSIIPLKIKIMMSDEDGNSRIFIDEEQDTFGVHGVEVGTYRRFIARQIMRPGMLWHITLETVQDSPAYFDVPICVGVDDDPAWLPDASEG